MHTRGQRRKAVRAPTGLCPGLSRGSMGSPPFQRESTLVISVPLNLKLLFKIFF